MSRWDSLGRICSVCREYKPWDNYSWKRSKRYKDKTAKVHQLKQPKCRSCAHLETKDWRERQSPERLRDLYLQRTYQINYSTYCKMLENQDYKCKICSRDLDTELGYSIPKSNTAVVDHCHISGEVRGILCNECNRGLGYFHDNKEALMNAITYLSGQERSPEGGQCSCLL